MSDDLIRRAADEVWREISDSKTQVWTLRQEHVRGAIAKAFASSAPTFTAADLEAAFLVGVEMAAGSLRDCPDQHWGPWCAGQIDALTPPADLVDLVRRKGGEG